VNPRRISRYCVTAGVAISWAGVSRLKARLDQLRHNTFRTAQMPIELKGSYIAADVKREATVSVDAALQQVADIVRDSDLEIWLMVADRTAFAGAGAGSIRAARTAALQFLFERVGGNPIHANDPANSWVVVTDHATSRETGELTRFMSAFQNPFTHGRLPSWVQPQALAGASEDWGGIQLADVFAFFGAHFRAVETGAGGVVGHASSFKTHLWPHLKRNAGGKIRGIGYKTW